jgi:hypothetical protein
MILLFAVSLILIASCNEEEYLISSKFLISYLYLELLDLFSDHSVSGKSNFSFEKLLQAS